MNYTWLEKHLPPMKCERCGGCCGIVLCTAKENRIIGIYIYNNRIKVMLKEDKVECPYYQGDECVIYPVRPYVCRMMGHAEQLQCFKGHTRLIKRRKALRLWLKYKEKLGEPEEVIIGSPHTGAIDCVETVKRLMEAKTIKDQNGKHSQLDELALIAQARTIANQMADTRIK